MSTATSTTKKWYQSKLFLLGVVLALTGVSDLTLHWISGNATLEQVQAVQTAYPQLSDGIKQAVEGKNYFAIITTVAGFLTAIWRAWFTNGKVSF